MPGELNTTPGWLIHPERSGYRLVRALGSILSIVGQAGIAIGMFGIVPIAIPWEIFGPPGSDIGISLLPMLAIGALVVAGQLLHLLAGFLRALSGKDGWPIDRPRRSGNRGVRMRDNSAP